MTKKTSFVLFFKHLLTITYHSGQYADLTCAESTAVASSKITVLCALTKFTARTVEWCRLSPIYLPVDENVNTAVTANNNACQNEFMNRFIQRAKCVLRALIFLKLHLIWLCTKAFHYLF